VPRPANDRPSRRHQLLAFALPRVLRAKELVDEEAERAELLARNRDRAAAHGRLPTRVVPGFARRFSVSTELLGAGGVEFTSFVITPRGLNPTKTLFYVHGGAFVSPIDRFHVRYVSRLADELGVRVVLPQYPLAPEYTWRDSYAALLRSLEDHIGRSPQGLVLAGDSAGGGLALALAIGLRDQGRGQPLRLLLHAPWGDLTTSTPETADYASIDTWLKYSKLLAYARWWAGTPEHLGRPEVSPTLAALDGLPPGLVIAGTRDLLLPGCRLLADRAATSSWELTYMERPGLVHVFGIMPFIPEAGQAFDFAVKYLRRAGW
jgi:epsilon-lactone hydrolase